MAQRKENFNVMSEVVEVVAAYVSHNQVSPEEVLTLIHEVYLRLRTLNKKAFPSLGEKSAPAVPIEESIQPDYLVCLEDGHRLKLLKRHLRTCYNMTPHQYRERWDLPSDYPMVAPNYAKRRSALAKNIALGTRAKSR